MMLTLTLSAVTGLDVATLHGWGFRVGGTLVHGVQIPLLVWADHLSLPWARGAALRALQKGPVRLSPGQRLLFNTRYRWRTDDSWCQHKNAPAPTPPHATGFVWGRQTSHTAALQEDEAKSCRMFPPASNQLIPHRSPHESVHLSHRSLSTANTHITQLHATIRTSIQNKMKKGRRWLYVWLIRLKSVTREKIMTEYQDHTKRFFFLIMQIMSQDYTIKVVIFQEKSANLTWRPFPLRIFY